MINLTKYPTSEKIFAFLEECEAKGIGDKPSERPAILLKQNFGMPITLGIVYEHEFLKRKKEQE